MLRIETARLIITEFTLDMAEAVQRNSLDADNRRFVPDEVFETLEEARETVDFLISRYGSADGPFVHPVLLREGTNIGYVQLARVKDGWEVGYHIAPPYTGQGYATEAVRAFLPVIAREKGVGRIYGICLKENLASQKVLARCGFKVIFEGKGDYQGSEREIVRAIWSSDQM